MRKDQPSADPFAFGFCCSKSWRLEGVNCRTGKGRRCRGQSVCETRVHVPGKRTLLLRVWNDQQHFHYRYLPILRGWPEVPLLQAGQEELRLRAFRRKHNSQFLKMSLNIYKTMDHDGV